MILPRRALLGALAAPAIIHAADACNCGSGGPGPAVTGSFVNANFSSLTGATVVRELFGGSTATMMDNGWVLCNDASFIAASRAMNPSLVRFNCNSGNSDCGTWGDVFGAPPGTPNWTGPNRFIANAHSMFNLPTTRIIMGIGGPSVGFASCIDTMSASTSQFASMALQIAQHFATTPGGDGNIVPIYGFEIMNEWDGRISPATYASYFNAAAVAIHGAFPNAKMYGPTTANSPGDCQAFVAATNATNLNGPLDDHAYLKCPRDPVPSDTLVVQAINAGMGTLPGQWSSQISNTVLAGTFAANYRMFNGEYNIDCADGDARQQDWRGAVYASSWVNKLVDSASHNNIVEAGIWEYGTAGNFYGQFVGSSGNWSPTPQARYLAQAVQVCPGLRVTVATAGTATAAGALSWSTVNGNHFSTTIVNPSAGAISGQVALSRWPVNGTGNGTISVWTQGQTNPNGVITSVAVTGGLTGTITIPTLGQVILSA